MAKKNLFVARKVKKELGVQRSHRISEIMMAQSGRMILLCHAININDSFVYIGNAPTSQHIPRIGSIIKC